jgi:putative redox protein
MFEERTPKVGPYPWTKKITRYLYPMITAHLQAEKYKTALTNGRHYFIADEPVAHGGHDLGPKPSEFLLSSLGACTAITVKMYADRKGWNLTDVQVDLDLQTRKEEGVAITEIALQMRLEGDLDEAQRARLMEIAHKCPIHGILTGKINIAATEKTI